MLDSVKVRFSQPASQPAEAPFRAGAYSSRSDGEERFAIDATAEQQKRDASPNRFCPFSSFPLSFSFHPSPSARFTLLCMLLPGEPSSRPCTITTVVAVMVVIVAVIVVMTDAARPTGLELSITVATSSPSSRVTVAIVINSRQRENGENGACTNPTKKARVAQQLRRPRPDA